MTDSQDQLQTLHIRLTEELLQRIESGEAKPADLNVARQLLKDNGIEAIPVDDSPLKKLLDTLPQPKDVKEFPVELVPN